MEINVHDEQQLVDIWLTGSEKDDPAVRAALNLLYDQYRRKKYFVATYISGFQALQTNTLELLKHNRRKQAEQTVGQLSSASIAVHCVQ